MPFNRWDETIRVGEFFHNNRSLDENRAGIVAAVKRSRWYKKADQVEFDGVFDIVENLESDVTGDDDVDVESFDYWWNQLYDLADVDRIWIDTFKTWPDSRIEQDIHSVVKSGVEGDHETESSGR